MTALYAALVLACYSVTLLPLFFVRINTEEDSRRYLMATVPVLSQFNNSNGLFVFERTIYSDGYCLLLFVLFIVACLFGLVVYAGLLYRIQICELLRHSETL